MSRHTQKRSEQWRTGQFLRLVRSCNSSWGSQTSTQRRTLPLDKPGHCLEPQTALGPNKMTPTFVLWLFIVFSQQIKLQKIASECLILIKISFERRSRLRRCSFHPSSAFTHGLFRVAPDVTAQHGCHLSHNSEKQVQR